MKGLLFFIVFVTTFSSSKINAQTNSKVMEKKKYSVEVIRYDIPESQWKQFENAYESAGKILGKSKYCLAYSINKGSEEPSHYIIIIHWTSEHDHLNGFRKSADFMSFFTLVKPFYNQIQEMKHYNETASWLNESKN